ncbi:MAG: hypothetical protein K5622_02035 [Endomicrobiaceae bacterium]|nr:hypothetical protein [Endomicrobiaceae bacterium]
MNKKIVTLLSFCLFFMMCLTSCERYPVRTLLGIPDRMDSWPDIWYIYDDEINTKGSLEPKRWEDSPYCAEWEKVKLSFACTNSPKNGRRCVEFTWVGNVDEPDKSFFGFGLMATENPGGIINLSTSNYTNLKFWIKGTVYTNCTFEISIPKDENTSWVKKTLSPTEVTPYWTEYSIPLPEIEDMTSIEYDISISLVANGISNGGTVYLDDIRFTKD